MHRQPSILFSLLAAFCCTAPALAQDSASYQPFGFGCAGSTGIPSLQATEGNLPRIGETFAIEFNNLPNSASPSGLIGLLGLSNAVWAGSTLPLELSPLGITGCTLFVSVQRADLLLAIGGNGTAEWTMHVDNDPSLIGAHFFTQGLVLDPSANPAGYVLTNAAEGIVGANAGPKATIIFPSKVASTDASSIIVRGTATDPSGVAEVRVNGFLASSGDGFANWQVRVPIAKGFTDLIVETRDRLGSVDTEAAQTRIESQALIASPTEVALDSTRNRALVSDFRLKTILSVDLETGNREIFSDSVRGVGSGPRIQSPGEIAIDDLNNRALVIDTERLAIFSIDLSTGDRRIVSDRNIGSGPLFEEQLGIALDGNRALVVSANPDSQSGQLLEVNLATGNRLVVSDSAVGQGEMWNSPISIVVDAGRAIVLDTLFFPLSGQASLGGVFAVDLTTGDRTKLSGVDIGNGPNLVSPRRIRLDDSRALVTDPSSSAIVTVDLVTGNRRYLSHTSRGSGPEFHWIWGLVIADGRAYVTDFSFPGIFAVDLQNGDRSLLTVRNGSGSGVGLVGSSGIVLDGDRALTISRDAIIAIDLLTGNRTLLSRQANGKGTGPRFSGLTGIGFVNEHAFVTNATELGAVMSTDLETGNRIVLSDIDHGLGPSVSDAQGLVIDGARALVTSALNKSVVSVDLDTGDRTLISEFGVVGSGPSFVPRGIVLDGERVIVSHTDLSSIVSVDLRSGDRFFISSPSLGSGPVFGGPIAMYGTELLVSGISSILTMNLETGDRSIISGDLGQVPGTSRGQGPRLGILGGIAARGSMIYVVDRLHGALFAIDGVTGERIILSQ